MKKKTKKMVPLEMAAMAADGVFWRRPNQAPSSPIFTSPKGVSAVPSKRNVMIRVKIEYVAQHFFAHFSVIHFRRTHVCRNSEPDRMFRAKLCCTLEDRVPSSISFPQP